MVDNIFQKKRKRKELKHVFLIELALGHYGELAGLKPSSCTFSPISLINFPYF